MKTNRTKKLVLAGLFTALVFIATAYLRITSPIGYLNLGDGVIFIAASVLGPFTAVVGAIGSAAADLAAGYYQYIPATLLIKGIMGFMAYYLLRNKNGILQRVTTFFCCEVIMVAGYFLTDAILYGGMVPALAGLPFNLIQGGLGLVIGIVGSGFIGRLKGTVFKKT